MNLIDRLLLRGGLARLKGLPNTPAAIMLDKHPFLWNIFGMPGQRYDIETMLRNYKGWVYICVRLIADAIAKIDLSIQKKPYPWSPDSEAAPIPDHPFLALLHSCPDLCHYDVKYFTALCLELTGSAYWMIVPNAMGTPGQIRMLLPQNIKLQVRPDGSKFYLVLDRNGGWVEVDEKFIIHFKLPSPLSLYNGFSPLEACGESVDVSNALSEYDYNRIKNNCIPPYIFTQDPEYARNQEDEELKRFVAGWKERFQGPAKAGEPGVLPGGWDIKLFDSVLKSGNRELSREKRELILCSYGVPLIVAGITEQAGYNRATAEVAYEIFLKNTIQPKTQRIEETLEKSLLNSKEWFPKLTSWIDLDFVFPEMGDKEYKLNETKALMSYMTVNEIRKRFNLQVLGPEGDVILLPMGIFPVSPNSLLEPQIPGSGGPEQPQKAFPEHPKALPLPPAKKDGMREYSWRHFALRTGRFEKRFLLSVRAYFRDLEDEQLRLLRAGNKAVAGMLEGMSKNKAQEKLAKSAIIDNLLFPKAEWDKKIEQRFKPILNFIWSDSKRLALQDIKLFQPKVKAEITPEVDYVGHKLNKVRLHGINETTREQLRRSLKEGYAEGESIDQLADRVQEVFSGINAGRAITIARTETISASNAGALEGYRESGVVEKKEWLAALDERNRETHADADGQVVGLQKSFSVGEDSLEYPGDPAGAPEETINCRCTVAPVLSEETE